MTTQQPGKPLIVIEDVEPKTSAPPRNGATDEPVQPPLIRIETLDDTSPLSPQPEMLFAGISANAHDVRQGGHWAGGWLFASVLIGVAGLAFVGIVEWILGLLAHFLVLGIPAVLATVALTAGAVGLVVREVRALRRLRDVEQLRSAWPGADGERLRRLILRVGTEMGDTAGARFAADLIDNGGPNAARRLMSRKVLAPRDSRASEAVASAARQGFVMITASPSPVLDAILLLGCAARLLRQIAVSYGYRPGTLALRSLALAAGRDAGAVVLADALAQAVAQSATHSVAQAGDAMVAIGSAATATGIAALIGIPMAVLGSGMSLGGRALGPAGGAVGGGAAGAWRLYRFGLMVLVAARPLPFDDDELREIKAHTQAGIFRMKKSTSDQQQGTEREALERKGIPASVETTESN